VEKIEREKNVLYIQTYANIIGLDYIRYFLLNWKLYPDRVFMGFAFFRVEE